MAVARGADPAPKRRRALSTRAHLVLLVAAVLLPALAFIGVATVRLADAVGDRILEDTHNKAGEAVAALDRLLTDLLGTAQILGASEALERGDLAAFHVRAIAAARVLDASIGLRDADSRQIVNSSVPWGVALPPRTSMAAEDAEVARTQRPAVSNVFRGLVDLRLFFAVVLPVQVGPERLPHFLSISVPVTRLQPIVAEYLSLIPGQTAGIVDRRGVLAAHMPEPARWLGQRSPYPQTERRPPDTAWVESGQRTHVAYRTSADAGWHVFVAIPEALMRAPQRDAVASLLLAGLAATLLGLTAAWLIGRQMTVAVSTLAAAGAALGRAAPVPVIATPLTEANAVGAMLTDAARERAAIEVALHESETRLRLAQEAGEVGVWQWVPSSREIYASEQMRRFYGVELDGPLHYQQLEDLVHEQDRAALVARRDAAIAAREPFEVEFRIIRADGTLRWISAKGRADYDADGRITRVLGINLDVTARREQAERQTLLAREVDHRAKNVLAVVRSILRLTEAENPEHFVDTVIGRMDALSRAHDLLSRDGWSGAALCDVVAQELDAFGGAKRAALDGPAVLIPPDAVQPLSMVLHELTTNAAKHGALSVPEGRLTVTWRVEKSTSGDMLQLVWLERGGPPVAGPPTRQGFGSQLIHSAARDQLGGAAAKTWDAEGVRCVITIPADRLRISERAGEARAAPGPVVPAEAISLTGRRVLVVEDEVVIAFDLKAMLVSLGCEVVGPAATLAEAERLALAEGDRLDAAMLDMNLRGQTSIPVADLLSARGVAVVFVTGYNEGLADKAGGREVLNKPASRGSLDAALRRAIAAKRAGTPVGSLAAGWKGAPNALLPPR